MRVVEADALRLDWSDLLGGEGAAPDDRWSLVANLPYNMAVPLVIRVLEEAPQVTSLLVMVQREVGERLAAGAGDEAYGAVSVKVAYWADATVVGRVSASVFIPRPRVESVLVRLDRRPERGGDGAGGGPGSAHYERLFAVVRAGFAHRRKMLRRCLDGLVRPEAFDARRHQVDRPGRGAVASGSGSGWRRGGPAEAGPTRRPVTGVPRTARAGDDGPTARTGGGRRRRPS